MASRSPTATEAATDRILRDLGQFQITSDSPRLSAEESQVLRLYEQLSDVQLRRAVVEAASDVPKGTTPTGDKLQQELRKAEREMLEARVTWLVRQHVVTDVLALDPVLKAVHGGASGASNNSSNNNKPTTDASAARSHDLHQLINQRDVLSLAHGNVVDSVQAAQRQLLDAQVRSMRAVERNKDMAADLRAVAAELKTKDVEHVEDRRLRDELKLAEAELEKARRRRRLIKGVVSAVVAGSGVDWAEDERLLRLVLEEDI